MSFIISRPLIQMAWSVLKVSFMEGVKFGIVDKWLQIKTVVHYDC